MHKVAVYAISKNEQQFVKRFLESCRDADYICISDTGSTDDTVKEIKKCSKELGIEDKVIVSSICISPWRFDTARNASLALVPSDVDFCICLDLDEVMTGDWKNQIIGYMAHSNPKPTRLRYKYIWNWLEDGSPGVTYWADKIHIRSGYRWEMPVHEMLSLDSRMGEEIQVFTDNSSFEIHHHADNTKPRSQYLPLLELAVKEQPYNDRQAHYYARELYFYGHYEKALEEFRRHLSLPTAVWNAERASSYRYMANCYWAMEQYENTIESLHMSVKEDSEAREGWVQLAQAYRAFGNWELVKVYCEQALSRTEAGKTYMSDPIAWSDWPQIMLNEAKEKLSHCS